MTKIDREATALSQNMPAERNTVCNSIPLACKTAKQCFNTTMAHLQPLASALAELHPSKFRAAMVWLESVYNTFISGEWEIDIGMCEKTVHSVCYVLQVKIHLRKC